MINSDNITLPTAHNMEFDYSGWRKGGYVTSPYTQTDWNQTLITKINQISAQIHMESFRGGADTIFVNNKINRFIETLEVYNVESKVINNRYKVEVDDRVPENIIIVRRVAGISDGTEIISIGVAEKREKKTTSDGNIETEFGEISFDLVISDEKHDELEEKYKNYVYRLSDYGVDKLNDFFSRVGGTIKIVNYEGEGQ